MSNDTNLIVMSNVDDYDQHYKISVSEIRTLQNCLKKHDYAYRQGLKSARPPSYLTVGRYAHQWLAEWATELAEGNSDPDLKEINRKVLWELRESDSPPIEEGDRVKILKVLEQFVDAVDMSETEFLAIEQEFYADLGWRLPVRRLENGDEIEMADGGDKVLLHGIFDLVIRDKQTNEVWVVEHKTAGRAWSEGQFMFDFQSPLYTEAWEELTGERPMGTLWNFFYTKRKTPTFDQKETYLSREEGQSIRGVVQDLVELRETGLTSRQPQWGCRGCWFRDLCYAEMLGGDGQAIRDTEYVVDEEKAARFS